MFEDNHNNGQDLLMRAILNGGQEDVPAHLWDGISEELDKIERRRKMALWWRRASVSVAAAAAVVCGVVLHRGQEEPAAVYADSSLVSVVESPAETPVVDIQEMTVAEIAEKISQNKVTAFADDICKPSFHPVTEAADSTPISEAAASVPVTEKADSSSATETTDDATGTNSNSGSAIQKTAVIQDDFDWGDEEETGAEKRRTTLTLSGITGSNNPQNRFKSGIIRQPSISKAPSRTGISESSKSTFGIPLSVGAGVKIDLSEKWAVGVGLDYTLLSRKFYGTYIVVNENGAIEGSPIYSDIRNNQHYVGIPVNVFYNILDNNHLNFYAYAGGSVEKCLVDSYHILNTTIVHKEDVKGVQLSAITGIGVEFMLGKHLGFYVDPRLRYYFNCNQPKSIRTEQRLMAGVEMGARIRL